jgi:hypothetical protein
MLSFSTSESAARSSFAAEIRPAEAKAPSTCTVMFSRTPSVGTIDSADRSALSERMPASSAARGENAAIGRPAHITCPEASSKPPSERIASRWPLPSEPAKPRISPARTSNVISANRAALKLRADSTISAEDVAGRSGYSASIGRPTISAIRSFSDSRSLTS